MKQIELNKLSNHYQVKKMTLDDVDEIYDLCKKNKYYYQYCGKLLKKEYIQQDLEITPPNIPIEQKYYVGFYKQHELIAIMDFIDGYPSDDTAFVGFFMMNIDKQGKGIGSQMTQELFTYLKQLGYQKIQLGIDKDNPQSNHFWKKQGLNVVREVVQEQGTILVAEKLL